MYRIGEFSKLTNLSIRTLRYYDEIGILVPEEVDIYTSYRYYGKTNLDQVQTINELKQAGFTLDEIKDNWNNFTEQILNQKKLELYQSLDIVENKIKQVDKLRSRLTKGKIKTTEKKLIKIKKL